MSKNKKNRPQVFEKPKISSDRDREHHYGDGNRQRGQKNPKKGRNTHKSDTPGGLMGRAENLIGHKKAGQSSKNKERRYS